MSTGDPCYKCQGKSFVQLDNCTWVPCPVCNNYGSRFFGGCPNCRDKDAELVSLRAELDAERKRNRWRDAETDPPDTDGDYDVVLLSGAGRWVSRRQFMSHYGIWEAVTGETVVFWLPQPELPEAQA